MFVISYILISLRGGDRRPAAEGRALHRSDLGAASSLHRTQAMPNLNQVIILSRFLHEFSYT